MFKKTGFLVILLISVCFSLGCGGGGGGGGGSLVTQITGAGPSELPIVPTSVPTINLTGNDGTNPFGVRRTYEPHDYDSNNILVNKLNVIDLNTEFATTTLNVDGEIKENGQIDISWCYKRPEEVSTIKVDLTGDIGTSLMELKYVGSSENDILESFLISGKVYTDKPSRLVCGKTVAGVWKVVLSIKGQSGKRINLSISRNSDDTFITSGPENFSEIYANNNFIERTKSLWPANKYSVANSINLTLQRFACKPTQYNIDIVLSYIIDARQRIRDYHILDKDTHIIVFNGTSADDHRENVSYCQRMGLTDIEFIDGPVDSDAKAKFLDAIIKSQGKTAILIHSHASLSKFSVKTQNEPTLDDFAKSFIYYNDLADALIKRAKNCGGKLDDISISYEACYSGDFAEKMLNYLSTSYDGEIKSLPLVITSSNRMQASWPIGFYPMVSELKNPSVITVEDMMIAEEKTFYPNDHAFFVLQDLEKFEELKQKLSVQEEGSGLAKNIPILDLNKVIRPVITGR